MKPSDALELALPELAKALRRKSVTSAALTEESLRRLDTKGRALNAVATLLPDRARAEAARADRELAAGHDRGPLHGIPYGAKDLIAARGGPTTWGAPMFKDRVIDRDATVVQKLADAGAVLVAKLATVQLAGGFGYYEGAASLQGPGRNPWDPSRWAGGSSSGPAAAVAARCVPFALGSETWGSILTPSAFCGVTGLRPTFGRVSRDGVMALSWTMDKVGPISLRAEDSLLVLLALAGPDAADTSTLEPPHDLRKGSQGKLRVAVVMPPGLERQDAAMHAALRQVVEALGRVAQVQDVPWASQGAPSHGIPADAVAALTVSAESASAFEDLINAGTLGQLTATDAPADAKVDQSILAVEYLRAQRIRAKLRQGYEAFFAEHDAVCTPALGFGPVVAPRLAQDFRELFSAEDPFGAAGNLLGMPAVSIPGPLVQGLPTGMQLMGPAWSEEPLVRCVQALQAQTSWHLQRPPRA